ncbi:T9SS type A sorting domain-containing protein [candidate division KSB1 bacterium]|nr:T9SS type A sorting domain-containing protein [candidate division KSB1 bacterium]NIU27024.1 T9SS type A sorting domain-containing protein [candidate division KSB1 bacterium]NIU92764.1 T9SS type A sorting domain-containing protein [candidate division KSB1 bacterium]NIW71359.1 T9SS type A sorting domain-containing protein [candidate division KSB1 bacterium]NIX72788.1 T9SS type A sorting domain-containing protein [candidate division KSB1 bacterium]
MSTKGQELSSNEQRRAEESFNQNLPSMVDSAFSVIGRWAWGPCRAVNARGNYAYVGNGPTFHVLDISDPASPEVVGEYLTDGSVHDIRLRERLAFVAIGRGLLILDISNPKLPSKMGEVEIKGAAIRVAVEDSFAYVTNFPGLLFVVDLSDVTNPILRGAIPVGGKIPSALAAKDGYAYVGNPEFPDLALIDATNPDSLKRSFISLGGWGTSAFVRDSLLFVGTRGYSGIRELKIFSVSKPASPNLIGQVEIGSEIRGITADGARAYVTTRSLRVYAVDISDPSQPQVVSMFKRTLPLSIGASAIALSGDQLLTAYFTGLLALNISNSDSLSEAWFFPTGGSARKVGLSHNLAYVASGYSGLWILDVSDVTNPVGLANINPGGFTSDVEVADDFAYIVNWPIEQDEATRGLWVIDISNPKQPKILSQYVGIARFSQTRAPNALAKSGDLIFMTQMPSAGNDSTFEIIDISDPKEPRRAGVFVNNNFPLDIAVQDSFAYLATSDQGLKIIDWREPSLPTEITAILGSALGVAISDQFVYVDRADTFFVVNMSNPRSPSVLGKFGRNYGSFTSIDLAVSKNHVYWAERFLGSIDVSDRLNPRERALFRGRGSGRGVAARQDAIFFADGNVGIWVLKNELITSIEGKDHVPSTPPERFQLYQNYPNPFNPETTIEFDVPNKAEVIIKLFNVLGQQVATLYKGIVPAGRHRINFDGSGLPSGVYFYRLSSAKGTSVTRKMMLIQ